MSWEMCLRLREGGICCVVLRGGWMFGVFLLVALRSQQRGEVLGVFLVTNFRCLRNVL